MRKIIPILFISGLIVVLVLQFKPVRQIVNALVIETNLINKDSLTIKTRVTPPQRVF